MKKTVWIAAILIIVIAVYFLYPRGSDEEQIRNVIKQGAEAIAAKKLGATLQHISRDYKDEYGLSFLAVRSVLQRWFGTAAEIDVEYHIGSIKIDKDSAQVSLQITVVMIDKGKPNYLIGDASGADTILLVLKKDGWDWDVIRVVNLKIKHIPF